MRQNLHFIDNINSSICNLDKETNVHTEHLLRTRHFELSKFQACSYLILRMTCKVAAVIIYPDKETEAKRGYEIA